MKKKRKGKDKSQKDSFYKLEDSLIHQVFLACIIGLIIIGSMIMFIGTKEKPYQNQKKILQGEFNTVRPAAGIVQLSPNDRKTFSIDNQGYTKVIWYVNNQKIMEGSDKYDFQAINGNYTIRVDMENGTRSESMSWKVVVGGENTENPLPKTGAMGFYMILSMIMILISIVLLIFIIEKNRQEALSGPHKPPQKKENSFAGKTSEPRNFKTEPKNDEENFFNIPS